MKFRRNWKAFDHDGYNLEGMTDGELGDFWADFHIPSKTKLNKLWPGGKLPAGLKETKEALATLAAMALDIKIAREARLKGEIQAAVVYEGHADGRYKRLPAWARW